MAGKNTILLFDGIFLTRHEINSYWDYRILLSIDAGTSLSRALVRDAKSMGSTDLIRRKYAERYEPAWEMYQILESPNAKVDVVIDNNDFTNPQILNARQYAVRACGL
jgi:uridine kinase